ncbi:hypothetical protein ACQPZX_14760 [Actinoplanes sp. CA-142083]|uniref:hypothetical protein n=1 Tax=Actinoplanes sp. CA-142083 TaxID=3239903 RepID=UPI003D92973F
MYRQYTPGERGTTYGRDGNSNVGNDRATMPAVITQLLPFAGYPRTLDALRALDEITL